MNLFVAIAIVAASTGIAITVLLLIRRRAPDGGYFNDGDRAAGFFGVLATGFAVLLGFIVFLAFTSYDDSLAGAETEALTLAQQFETAQFFPDEEASALSGQLVCYGRSVVHDEWPEMEAGDAPNSINPWAIELFQALERTDPQSASQQAAFSKWLDQTSDREAARNDRIHGAEGVIPAHLWIVIFLGAGVIFVFMLFFADSGERAVVQALQIGTVVAVTVATLLVIRMLNSPFSDEIGGLRPVAMERTLGTLEEARAIVGQTGELPCDEDGTPSTIQR